MSTTIATLGPSGTHSEAAAKYLHKKSNIVLYPTISSTIKAIEDENIDFCMVPIENSLEGSINVTLDSLSNKYGFSIINELVWPIKHHLLVLDENATIKTIVSHPQALAQCMTNIKQLFPDLTIREVSSTAEAAQIASQDSSVAAIGSYDAAKIYALKIKKENMQDNSINCTRFVTISKNQFVKPEKDATKTSIVCELNGEKPGTLYELLKDFALKKINLVRIESRPAKTILGRYIFYLDFEGSMNDEEIAQTINDVEKHTLWLKVIGSYPVFTHI